MSNRDKNLHGKNGKDSILELIKNLFNEKYIIAYGKDVKFGYKDKAKQFHAQYVIEFADGKKWVLHSTTSIRDRINIQQWNSEHIKLIDEAIEKFYVVYPDNITKTEFGKAKAFNQKIILNKIHSAIDGVVDHTMIYNLVEEKALSGKNTGSAKAIKGMKFENRIAYILNNKQNLNIWKTNSTLETGLYYSTFKKIVTAIGLDADSTESLSAAADIKIIKALPSRGKPKTDVLLTIFKTDGAIEHKTFSCKRTSSKTVSAHQYSAESFCQVLNITDEKLKAALFDFQR